MSSINIGRNKRDYFYITSEYLRKYIRSTIHKIGEKKLGIKASAVGTDSIRTTFAMILMMNKILMPKIMKLGRWKSLAVFEYIRANIEDFSEGISECIANDSTGFFLQCQISYLLYKTKLINDNKTAIFLIY